MTVKAYDADQAAAPVNENSAVSSRKDLCEYVGRQMDLLCLKRCATPPSGLNVVFIL